MTVRAVEDRLPEPLRWHSYEAQTKVQQMDRLARRGGADVVSLGTSMMNGALEPSDFVRASGGGLVVYNAALSKGVPKVMLPWATHTVLPRLRPSLVVIGLSSPDVNAALPGADAFAAEVAAAPAAQREWGSRDAVGKVEDAIGDASALVRARSVVRRPWSVIGPAQANESRHLGPFGSMRIQRGRTIDPGPAAERAAAAAVRGFRIDEATRRTITALVGAVHRAGARAVLVAMPVHGRYAALHPGGAADVAAGKRLIADIASATGARYVDLDRLDGDRFFADVIHVNAAGSRWFSESLARWTAEARLVPARRSPSGTGGRDVRHDTSPDRPGGAGTRPDIPEPDAAPPSPDVPPCPAGVPDDLCAVGPSVPEPALPVDPPAIPSPPADVR